MIICPLIVEEYESELKHQEFLPYFGLVFMSSYTVFNFSVFFHEPRGGSRLIRKFKTALVDWHLREHMFKNRIN